jgi:hypothetical protein
VSIFKHIFSTRTSVIFTRLSVIFTFLSVISTRMSVISTHFFDFFFKALTMSIQNDQILRGYQMGIDSINF